MLFGLSSPFAIFCCLVLSFSELVEQKWNIFGAKNMARLTKRKKKNGWSHIATIRIKGYPSVSRTFDTKGEALAWAVKTEESIKAKKYNDPRLAMSVSFSQAVQKYLDTISCNKAITTHMREKASAARLVEQIGTETPFGSISTAIVAQYRDTRLKEVSAYSVRQELALLSHLFTKAKKEWGIPVENPVSGIERPAPPRGRTRFLTEEEASKLLEACRKARNKSLYYYVLTLLHTGMRASEAAGLYWRQINFKKRVAYLSDTKNKDPRWVPLTHELVAELSSLRELTEGRDENMVFLNEGQLQSDRVKARPGIKFREAFDAAKKRAGLPDIHMHDLRHTAASHLIMAGVDIRTLADILGHRTLQMVQRYTHLLHDHKLLAIDKIGKLGQGKE
jgi:integrase